MTLPPPNHLRLRRLSDCPGCGGKTDGRHLDRALLAHLTLGADGAWRTLDAAHAIEAEAIGKHYDSTFSLPMDAGRKMVEEARALRAKYARHLADPEPTK